MMKNDITIMNNESAIPIFKFIVFPIYRISTYDICDVPNIDT